MVFLLAIAPGILDPGLASVLHRPAQAQSLRRSSLRWSFPSVVNDDMRGAAQHSPAVTLDSGGVLHAVWVDYRSGQDGGEVFYARLQPGSSRWESNLRVVGGGADVVRADPAVAVDSLGIVHVVWAETRSGRPDIFHRFLPDGARAFTESERVNDDVGAAVQMQPTIAADLWGSVHVVWVDLRNGPPQLFYSRRLADRTWSANLPVTFRPQGVQGNPGIAAVKTGDIYVVWEESRGGKNDVYASRLPPGGDVWWPPHELSLSPARSREHSPSIASDSTGALHAVWIDDSELGVLRMAALPPTEAMWHRDRVVYRATRGELLSTALGGGPGGQVVAVWGESRPEAGLRLYGGRVATDGDLVGDRVDGTAIVTNSEMPAAAVDTAARAHVVWVGRARDGQAEIYYSSAQLPTPTYEQTEATGWLQYYYGAWNCPGDGFVTVACDGTVGPFIVPQGTDFTPFLGSYVVVTGAQVEDTGCTHIRGREIKLATAPCPRETGAVTGVLVDDRGPVARARVYLGEDRATRTGVTGRYFFDAVEPGSYALTATLPCALMVSAGEVAILRRPLTTQPPGVFVRGEVIDDCAIDLRDLVRVTAQYKAWPPFHPACSDQDWDDTVSLSDIVLVAANYGRACPSPWRGALAGTGGDPPAEGRAPVRLPVSRNGQPSIPADRWGSEGGARRTSRVRLPLVVKGTRGLYGWAIELAYDPTRVVPADTDPRAQGVQPFDAQALPDGAWLIENLADPDRGRLRLAAALVAPAQALAGDVTLGRLVLDRPAEVLPESVGVELLGRDGLPVPGQLGVIGQPNRESAGRLWLPLVGDRPR